MKEVKRKISGLILNIATGSQDPTIFNQNVQELSKLSDVMIDHIDEIEKENVATKALYETLTSDHESLKQKYHEKWKNEDLGDGKEHEGKEVEKEYTDEDIINELTELSEKGE